MGMVPGDDQLIPYGEDTTVSVQRSQPGALQTDEVVAVNLAGGKRLLDRSVELEHRRKIVTRYVLRNNGTRRIPRLYVDHTASPAAGGFTILTTDRAVKTVTGFSRYSFDLQPQ